MWVKCFKIRIHEYTLCHFHIHVSLFIYTHVQKNEWYVTYHRSHAYGRNLQYILIHFELLWQWTLSYSICQELVALLPFSVAHQTPTTCSSHMKPYVSSSLIVLSDISRYMWTWIFHWPVKLLFPQSYPQLLQDGNRVPHFTYILTVLHKWPVLLLKSNWI